MAVQRLILVRHGETPANIAQVWHGQRDTPLSEKGERQRWALSSEFHQYESKPDRIVSSTLQRARLTAEAVASKFELPVTQFPQLMEYDIGEWEGQSYDALRNELNFFARMNADALYRPPGGESREDVTQRFVAQVESLCADNDGSLVVVAHGMAIAFALSHWLTGNSDQWLQYRMDNTGVSDVNWPDKQLASFNGCKHLTF